MGEVQGIVWPPRLVTRVSEGYLAAAPLLISGWTLAGWALMAIGSTLGNTLSSLLQDPAPLFAALGFAAVFAGATNTPLACTIMGIERKCGT